MNVENRIEVEDAADPGVNAGLLARSFDGLSDFAGSLDEMEAALGTLAEAGDRTATKAARKLQRQLRRFEPAVTMIGQVKAGKTSLVNAMIGWPGLLPADVNPWTSVVTSIHISPRPQLGGNHASFRFFEDDEWARLLERGGRIGELAGRAGAEDEVQKVTQQLEAMREKSRRRLGNRFEMLMGQEHSYGYFDSELIQRYVCLGDDFETDTETSSTQGRFADITKSADLFMQRAEFPIDLCIRDTPGVNDTFMMREQITIRAIRESRMCVVVLSAHQALSTVDMALIRMISNLPSREVTIFVNRIDELSNPAAQVPEIRESIRRTLKEHQGPADAEIVFGSAYWATHALTGALEDLDPDSKAALYNWAAVALPPGTEVPAPDEMLWALSGVPELISTVMTGAVAGLGREAVSRTAKSALNVLSGIATGDHIVSARSCDAAVEPLDRSAIPDALDRLEEESFELLEQAFGAVVDGFQARLDRAHRSFLDRATASLISHLEKNGDGEVWQYDATGLRVLLRSTFNVFAKNARTCCEKAFLEATGNVRELYLRAFNLPEDGLQLEAPPAPHVPAPVMLGQTVALDLSTNWWSRWWRRRRGYTAYATDFAQMIKAETDPIVEGLRAEHADAVLEDAQRALEEFFASQREMILDLARQAHDGPGELRGIGGAELEAKADDLAASRAIFERHLEMPAGA